MLPVPLAASPIEVLSFVQLYEVAPLPAKVIAVVLDPAQIVWLPGLFTTGVGLTVMVKLCGVPLQLTVLNVYTGVTVIVATTGLLPVLVAVKLPVAPVPAPPRPIDVSSLLQS